MVAIITTGSSIQRIFNYNENKVKDKVATCIAAANYPMDVEKLSFTQKLNRLLKQCALNENVKRNSVHVSLNFDPSEKLSNDQLRSIAERYMHKIGFGEQPYLVYQHFDAGHPHIHIVSIKVRADGTRIDMQNIGRNQSETARKEIEQQYGLVIAGKPKKDLKINSAYVSKVVYGKSESRKAIAKVLEAVLDSYKYTSVPELNAVLQQYNVVADMGNKGSRVFNNQGLLYRIIDEKGRKVGIPIKASSFCNKPTLKFLEAKFKSNETGRQPHKARVKNAIDLALIKQTGTDLQLLIKRLEKEGIATVLRRNADGVIYGVTYLDYRTKCVFNGSALGKEYSAKAIQARCGQQLPAFVNNTQSLRPRESFQPNSPQTATPATSEKVESIMDILLKPDTMFSHVPMQLPGKRRKKKKKDNSKRI